MLKWSFHEIVTLSRTFLYFLVIVVVSRAFCELHMILSLLHALTPKHFSSIAQALICWDLSYCQVQCLNQYTNRLDKSTSHKFLSRSQYGITNQEKK